MMSHMHSVGHLSLCENMGQEDIYLSDYFGVHYSTVSRVVNRRGS